MTLTNALFRIGVGLFLCSGLVVLAQDPPAGKGPPAGTPGNVPVPDSAEVLVDCDNGDSINDALKTPAVHLTVRIRGFCDENAVISHLSNVTLVGDSGDPTLDGIRGTAASGELPSFGNVLFVEHSSRVEVIDLTLRDGSRNGIAFVHSGFRQINNCRLLDNANHGIVLHYTFGGRQRIQDTTISGNRGVRGSGANIPGGVGIRTNFSRFNCSGCTIFDNPIAGEGIAMFPRESSVVVEDSDLQGLVTVLAGPNSDVIVRESMLDGVWRVIRKSILRLRSVTQTSPGGFNNVFEDSLLTSTDGPVVGPRTTLVDTRLVDFSKAIISDWTLDDLFCEDLAEAICDGVVILNTSTCSSCP